MSSSSPNPLTLRLTQGTTLFFSSLLTGASISFSTILVPRLLESPTPLMLQQWAHAYKAGTAVMPAAAGATAAGFFWLAAKVGGVGPGGLNRGYLAAGALTVGIVPYTVAVMLGTNGRLMEAERRFNGAEVKGEGEVKAEEEKGAKALVDWWGVLNLGRAVLLGAGAVCGFVATI